METHLKEEKKRTPGEGIFSRGNSKGKGPGVGLGCSKNGEVSRAEVM